HLAADHGIRVMALTDHDSFYGVLRARAAAHRRGLGYVTGVEVSPYPPLQVRHILGHGVDREPPQLLAVLRPDPHVMPHQTPPSPQEAVDAIHAAGGLAVHAHPGVVPDQDLMKEVLPLVDGLEVYTRRHKPEQIPVYEELARQYGLIATVGSDYHGFNGERYAM